MPKLSGSFLCGAKKIKKKNKKLEVSAYIRGFLRAPKRENNFNFVRNLEFF